MHFCTEMWVRRRQVLHKEPKGRDVDNNDIFHFNNKFDAKQLRIKINSIQVGEGGGGGEGRGEGRGRGMLGRISLVCGKQGQAARVAADKRERMSQRGHGAERLVLSVSVLVPGVEGKGEREGRIRPSLSRTRKLSLEACVCKEGETGGERQREAPRQVPRRAFLSVTSSLPLSHLLSHLFSLCFSHSLSLSLSLIPPLSFSHLYLSAISSLSASHLSTHIPHFLCHPPPSSVSCLPSLPLTFSLALCSTSPLRPPP